MSRAAPRFAAASRFVIAAASVLLLATCRSETDGGTASAGSPPTDRQMRDLVRTHRATLDRLRVMITAEPRLRVIGDDVVGDCWRFPDGWSCRRAKPDGDARMLRHVDLTTERWASYRALLGRIGGHQVSSDGEAVRIAIHARGIAPSGVSKDLLFSPSAPSPLVADTDADRPSGYTVNYAALGDGWYVEHSSN